MNILDYIRNPERYKECGHCNGYGSSLKESGSTCSVCGGSGCTVDVEKGIEEHYVASGIDVPE